MPSCYLFRPQSAIDRNLYDRFLIAVLLASISCCPEFIRSALCIIRNQSVCRRINDMTLKFEFVLSAHIFQNALVFVIGHIIKSNKVRRFSLLGGWHVELAWPSDISHSPKDVRLYRGVHVQLSWPSGAPCHSFLLKKIFILVSKHRVLYRISCAFVCANTLKPS